MRNTPLGQAFLARVLAGTAIATGLSLALAAPAYAQGGEVTLAVKAGSLSAALNEFASQTGYQLLYPSDLVAGKTSSGTSGAMSVSEGLSRVLSGTGLTFTLLDGKTIQISGANAAGGELVTGAVKVEGAQGSPYFGGVGVAAGVNGLNGSRDITATEGTGSFTSGALTIGSKAPQALKDVPQSISVLTNERLEQQNVTDFATAMKQLPGVTLVQGGSSLENTFYSRGFEITSIQIDGGAPLTTSFGGNTGVGYFPQIDMSIYDHVELLRGAAGLFNGYGDPSGTVNLVRKKPLDHAQVTAELQAGSWSNYRTIIDASSPLALAGSLRGRLVMTFQDNHYFYETARDNKALIYGIAELDVTPTTLVTAGVSYMRQNSVPWLQGLPRYQTGEDIGLPRSTSFVFPWNRWNFDTTEIFGIVEQKLGEEWSLKLNLTHNRQQSARKLGFNSGAVNPETGLGPALSGIYNDYASKQFSAEATLTGAFTLLGQRQEITIGANRVDSDAGGRTSYAPLVASSTRAPYEPYPGGPRFCYWPYPFGTPCPAGTVAPATPPINVFDFDPTDPLYTEPRNPLPSTRFPTSGQVQSGAYVNLRLTAFDRLHLTTGLRWSRYESKFVQESLCANSTGSCLGKEIGDVYSTYSSFFSGNDFSWPPPVNLSFDLTKELIAYLGYTDIYRNQSTSLDVDLKAIAPITGSNWEAGLKWAARDGRLNFALAAFQIRQRGFGILNGTFDSTTGEFVASNGDRFANYGEIDPNHYCCYKADPNNTYRSKGADIEVTGEVLPGWQMAASLTYNETKLDGSSFGSADGKPLISIQPKYLYKLWMSYDFSVRDRTDWLSRLTLSGGVNGQSSAYFEGTGCLAAYIVTNPVTGAASCGAGGDYTYAFTVPSYAILSARLDYRFSKAWSLAVNLENLLDKTYYQTVGGSVDAGNWYGAPRSVTATLRAKW